MKLNIYKNGDSYIQGGGLTVTPIGVKPDKVYDLQDLTDEEIDKFKKNHKNKKLLKKVKKL